MRAPFYFAGAGAGAAPFLAKGARFAAPFAAPVAALVIMHFEPSIKHQIT